MLRGRLRVVALKSNQLCKRRKLVSGRQQGSAHLAEQPPSDVAPCDPLLGLDAGSKQQAS